MPGRKISGETDALGCVLATRRVVIERQLANPQLLRLSQPEAALLAPAFRRMTQIVFQCLFAKKQCEEAARELLKVDILYAYPEWSAAALYEAGRCFEALGKPVEARAQYATVVEKHDKTKGAELANQRLPKLKDGGLPTGNVGGK